MAGPSRCRRGHECGGLQPGGAGSSVGKLQSKLDLAGSTLSHHLKALIAVGLVAQERQGTTLICKANYDVMRGIVDFLVAECCAESSCDAAAQPEKAA